MLNTKNLFSMLLAITLFGQGYNVHAADSYRWLHVTIDTPWAIFIFLLPMVLVPVILMAILYWRYANVPKTENNRKKPEDGIKKESTVE